MYFFERIRIVGFILGCFFSFSATAQTLKGYILTADNEPVPYAHVFVQETQTGAVTDMNGFYYLRLEVGGEFEIKVSCLGYQERTIPIVLLDNQEVTKNILLETSSVELEGIVIQASKKDPAYEIIQNAIEQKKKYLKSINSYKTEIYVKATEIIETKESSKSKPAKKVENPLSAEKQADPFEIQKAENQKLMNSINLVEMQMTLNYQYPRKYKEIRTAYKKYGTDAGLFVPRFGETDFNFYRNMVRLTGITDAPLISPLSNTSILSYKFRLIESKKEGGVLVHKIKVTPRKSGNSTCSGFIYINDEWWNIHRVELNLYKGSLKFYDAFELRQHYKMLSDSTWIPYRQEFRYQTKQGRKKLFRGNTTLYYSDFQVDYAFPEKFFNHEISRIEPDAYRKDSLYWNSSRPEPLTPNERKIIALRDSIQAVTSSKSYQDSIQLEYNRIKFIELFWEGVGFRNHVKRTEIYLGSFPSMLDFQIVGGWRVGPFVYHFKGWENGKLMSTTARVTYGFQNQDYNGNIGQWMRYDPHRLADFSWKISRQFESINSFDAYLNQINSANYILNESAEASHRIELLNGLYVEAKSEYANRQSIQGFHRVTIFDEWVDSEEQPLEFDPYKALITNIKVSYTPKQRFMTEPNRKVVLGSNYPTWSINYRKGWHGILNSAIDFDYLEFQMQQDVILGSFGHSKYQFSIGDFIHTKTLKLLDVKRFRQSDPLLYSDPLRSFQVLDTAFFTSNLFVEFHHIHHFNGAFINNIPLIKKTGVRLVAGGGFLWVRDSNFRHEEIFAGLERVFKLGARRRLRLGVYGVLANGNYTRPKEAFKVSIDIIDTWKKNWNF